MKKSLTFSVHPHTMPTGVCQVDPELLDFEEMEELTDFSLPYWILSGSDIHCEKSTPDSDYPLDLDSIPEGSKVGLRVTSDGNLHFFINGADMGVAASGLPMEGEGFIIFFLPVCYLSSILYRASCGIYSLCVCTCRAVWVR